MTKEEMLLVVEEFLAKMREFETTTILDTTRTDLPMWFWSRFYKKVETNTAFIEFCNTGDK